MSTASPEKDRKRPRKVVSLAGGVGGAKLAHGFILSLDPDALTVIVNTADDFDHLGLRICPDLDTVMYTLGGVANPVTGWGIAGDTMTVLDTIRERGGPGWFQLGDRDFATHIVRTAELGAGRTLTEVTTALSSSFGIQATILPMSDDQVATEIRTPAGTLSFQDYFVRKGQQDVVLAVEFRGAANATAAAPALEAIADAEVIVMSPSNPIVSIGPILAIAGFGDAIRSSHAPRIAVSPLIGGKALKGPADRMMATLGHEPSALGIARLYAGLIDGLVIDHVDRSLSSTISELGIAVLVTDAVMRNEADRARLAREVIDFAHSVERQPIAL
ncbi:MAG: 2-phospho-L-lactate transferase [Thermomicrobiales bacterium]